MTNQGLSFLLVPLLLVLALGCGKGLKNAADIKGKVIYKDKPVTGGTITFHSKEAGSYSAPIDPEGNYTATQLPIGEMIVTVETESLNPKNQQGRIGGRQIPASPMPDGTQDGAVQGTYMPIPAKFSDKTKTPLKADLSKGKQEKDFTLTD